LTKYILSGIVLRNSNLDMEEKEMITMMAMYLNTVYQANFDYFWTFIGDIILFELISGKTTNKIKIKKDSSEDN